MVLYTSGYFFPDVLLDPLYCWHYWGVTSISAAGEGAAHHLLYPKSSGSSSLRRREKVKGLLSSLL